MDYRLGKCSQCGAEYKIPSSFQHDVARCKECSGVVNVGPTQSADAPAAPAAKPAPPKVEPMPESLAAEFGDFDDGPAKIVEPVVVEAKVVADTTGAAAAAGESGRKKGGSRKGKGSRKRKGSRK